MTIGIGGGAELELVRQPRAALEPCRAEALVRELLPIVRSGFGKDEFTERQVTLAAIDVPYGAFVRRAGELVGMASASLLAPEDVPSPVLYLGTAALAPHVQGHGCYQALLLARFAIGAVAGATHFTTRTQSPIVCRALKAFGPYPFTPGGERYRGLARAIARELDGHGPRSPSRPGGLSFDEATGVMRQAYDASLYAELPRSGDPGIDGSRAVGAFVDTSVSH